MLLVQEDITFFRYCTIVGFALSPNYSKFIKEVKKIDSSDTESFNIWSAAFSSLSCP